MSVCQLSVTNNESSTVGSSRFGAVATRMKTIISVYFTKTEHPFFLQRKNVENYLGEEPASTEEGDEMPIAEPFREL